MLAELVPRTGASLSLLAAHLDQVAILALARTQNLGLKGWGLALRIEGFSTSVWRR